MKYDDLTLMMYADGELDPETSLELKKDLLQDPALQERLKVFTGTREALLKLGKEQNSKIPEHISQLIDKHDREPRKSNLIPFFRAPLPLSLAATLIIGIVVGAGGMRAILPSATSPGLEEFQPVYRSAKNARSQKEAGATPTMPKGIMEPGYSDKELTLGIKALLDSLSVNPERSVIIFQNDGKRIPINIVADFENSAREKCKLTELESQYLVACLDTNNRWSVKKTR